MSVLIKGMTMPHNCFLCPLSVMNGERVYCEVTKDEVLRAKIAQDCPLIELPPHGDLIDRDEQIERAWRLNLSTRELIEEMLKTAPTILEAEEGET